MHNQKYNTNSTTTKMKYSMDHSTHCMQTAYAEKHLGPNRMFVCHRCTQYVSISYTFDNFTTITTKILCPAVHSSSKTFISGTEA